MAKTVPEKKQQQPPPLGVYCKLLAGKNKLVLCHVSTSKQLKLQRELKSIMETYGFVCLSDPDEDANSAWAEYIFPAAGDDNTLPKPNLPANRIDGLHIYTYRAFLDAVNHYLQMDNISDLFIIQSIPVRRPPDARLTWRLAEVENESFVYRAQTLKKEVFDYYEHHGNVSGSSFMIHSTGIDDSTSFIPELLEDSVVTDDQNKNENFVFKAQTLKREVFHYCEHHHGGSGSSSMIHSTGINCSTFPIPDLLEDSVVTDDQNKDESFVYRAQTLKGEAFDYYEHHRGGSCSSSMNHSTGIDGSTSSIPDLLEDSVVTDDQNKNENFVYRAQTLNKEVFDYYEHHDANGSHSSSMIHGTGIDGSTSSIPHLLEDPVVTDDHNKNERM